MSSETRPGTFRGILLCLLLITGVAGATPPERIAAPPFPKALTWLNVSRPLTLDDLKGRMVILDFWTYGCVNCLHVADELRQLEQRFGDELLVIGIHSPKFPNERRIDTLRRILLRYDRRHPVIQDPDWLLMKGYGARAWPTLVVIDPDGKVLGYVTGEGHAKRLEQLIETTLAKHPGLSPPPLPLRPEAKRVAASDLAGPASLLVAGERIIISDTLHHRLLITDPQGGALRIIGDGTPGLRDGPSAEARFTYPQGLALHGDSLLVADSGNHAVRHVDLTGGSVSTLAGTGRVGRDLHASSNALTAHLRSPMDLAVHGNHLYIAMAGAHQIWRMELDSGSIAPYAGSGAEGLSDGPLRRARFSQPSALTLIGDRLYVADAEASAVREIDLSGERVGTLLGSGLFDYGDRDGAPEQARLQHPQGIAVLDQQTLLIADTYNHKIKAYDLTGRRLTTLIGSGRPGNATDRSGPSLFEPGGIASAPDGIWIADTNNDRLLRLAPGAQRLTEIRLPPPPKP